LVKCNFRLPGESQKIDRLVEAFSKRFSANNPGLVKPDAAYLLSFAAIMLNTDLHDQRLTTGKNPRKPMTKEGFMKNVRAAPDGADLSTAFLSDMFDSIAKTAIEWKATPSPSTASNSAVSEAGSPGSAVASATMGVAPSVALRRNSTFSSPSMTIERPVTAGKDSLEVAAGNTKDAAPVDQDALLQQRVIELETNYYRDAKLWLRRLAGLSKYRAQQSPRWLCVDATDTFGQVLASSGASASTANVQAGLGRLMFESIWLRCLSALTTAFEMSPILCHTPAATELTPFDNDGTPLPSGSLSTSSGGSSSAGGPNTSRSSFMNITAVAQAQQWRADLSRTNVSLLGLRGLLPPDISHVSGIATTTAVGISSFASFQVTSTTFPGLIELQCRCLDGLALLVTTVWFLGFIVVVSIGRSCVCCYSNGCSCHCYPHRHCIGAWT
jgi:hypothetical protein